MIIVLNSISTSWWNWMSAMFWQLTILIIFIFLLDLFLEKWIFPQLRYSLWLLVLIKLVIPPDYSLPSGVFSPVESAVAPYFSSAETSLPAEEHLPEVTEQNWSASINGSEEVKSEGREADSGITFISFFFLVWLAGVALFMLLMVIRITELAKWNKKREIPDWYSSILHRAAELLKLTSLPSIVFSDEIETPAVYGLFRPVLVLPREFAESLSRKDLFYMTLHELSHLKRKDLWTHAFAVLLQCLYWINPLMLLVQAKLRHTREICCDLTVSRALKGSNKHYTKTLVAAAKRLLTRKTAPALGLLGVFEDPHQIINRIKWLEKKMTDIKPLTTISVVGIAALFIIFVFPMSGSKGSPVVSGESNQDGRYAPELENGQYLHMITSTRKDSLAFGITVDSKPQGNEEIWMNNNRIAIIQDKTKIVLDLEKREFLYLNRFSQKYVRSGIPVDEKALYDDDLQSFFASRRFEIKLENTGRKKKILGRVCDVWLMKRTVINSQGQRWGGTLEIWVDSKVKINYEPFMVVMDNIRRITGGDAEARGKMQAMKGFQHRIDYNADSEFFGEKLISEIEIFEYSTPPQGMFSPPEGYQLKEKIAREDLY